MDPITGQICNLSRNYQSGCWVPGTRNEDSGQGELAGRITGSKEKSPVQLSEGIVIQLLRKFRISKISRGCGSSRFT